jgi:phage baseplate assembly protein W|tara:strand:+ start:340 stop:747 length:408 start_codon:yes stop_codon:yes gene_type:complete
MPIIQSLRRISPLDLNKNIRVGVAFPLNDVNLFDGTQTVKEQVKSNLINVLLTETGERINEPNFGVGLRGLLFESNVNIEELNERINQQINVYIPEITLIDTIVDSLPDENKLFIKIVYVFNLDNTTDSIQLNFD